MIDETKPKELKVSIKNRGQPATFMPLPLPLPLVQAPITLLILPILSQYFPPAPPSFDKYIHSWM